MKCGRCFLCADRSCSFILTFLSFPVLSFIEQKPVKSSLSSAAGQAANAERAKTTNIYAQPFALTDHYKAARSTNNDSNAGRKDDFVPELNLGLACPECKTDPANLVEEFDSGDMVCADCGMVVGDKIIDTRSEWRTFANEEGDDPSRVGSSNNPLMDGLTEQLDTRISYKDGGSGAARDLQRAMNRGVMPSNRVILDAFDDIQRKCDQVHLPRVVSDTAKHMFKQVEQDQILRGKQRDAIIAAAIYCACKTNKVPRTFREICQLTNVSQKLIGKCFKEMQSAYGLNLHRAPDAGGANGIDADSAVSPTNAVDLVGRFCNHLGLDMSVTKCTEDVAGLLRDKGILAGRSPITVAATCIYLITRMLGQDVSAKKISAAAGVSDVTIKGSSRTLSSLRNDWLTPAILAKYPKFDINRLP